MKNELAIDVDGQPFPVPPEVTGWRVRRVEGRGRPELAYDRLGRPLLLPVDATHTDLLTAAGPGRYRLDPVDARGHICTDVPVGCTGTIQGPASPERAHAAIDTEGPGALAGLRGSSGGTPVRAFVGYDDILCETIRANTRIAELVVSRFPAMLSATGELLMAADGASITKRLPLPPAPAPEPSDADDSQELAIAPPAGLPDMLQMIIREVVAKAVPMIIDRFTGGTSSALGGFPLGALFDWRKARVSPEPAVPDAVPGPAASPNHGAVAPQPGAWKPSATNLGTPMQASSAHAPTTTPIAMAQHAPTAFAAHAPAVAGAAPSHDPSLGAAPAEPEPVASATEHVGAQLNAHILAVWRGLFPEERASAGHLIAGLSQEQRTAWLAALTRLSVPEAIARARATLQAPPSLAHDASELPSATASGDGT